MPCRICGRATAEGIFCPSHLLAHDRILEKYKDWKKALELSWRDYLVEIEKNPLIGEWAKEVAQYLIAHEESKNV